MKYMLLIYGSEAEHRQLSPEALQAEMAAYYAYSDAAQKAGVLVASNALHEVQTAKTVRVREGKALTTDGPFAETKEQLGGYYLLDCKDLDEAIKWAAKLPGAAGGSVEIRPIVVFG
ncbi:MAG: YciI family protein [Chloroflexi bacterium]|nr:YciI family protein [Chloroflexota bacterium]